MDIHFYICLFIFFFIITVNSISLHLPLPPRVHGSSCTNLDLAACSRPVTRQKSRQEILIHQILLPLPPLVIQCLGVLLLVLSQDQVPAPAILATNILGQSSIGTAVDRLGHAKHVSAVIPLKVLLEVNLEVAMLVRRAARPREGGLAALGAELLIHILCDVEAAVAPQNPRLEICDA